MQQTRLSVKIPKILINSAAHIAGHMRGIFKDAFKSQANPFSGLGEAPADGEALVAHVSELNEALLNAHKTISALATHNADLKRRVADLQATNKRHNRQHFIDARRIDSLMEDKAAMAERLNTTEQANRKLIHDNQQLGLDVTALVLQAESLSAQLESSQAAYTREAESRSSNNLKIQTMQAMLATRIGEIKELHALVKSLRAAETAHTEEKESLSNQINALSARSESEARYNREYRAAIAERDSRIADLQRKLEEKLKTSSRPQAQAKRAAGPDPHDNGELRLLFANELLPAPKNNIVSTGEDIAPTVQIESSDKPVVNGIESALLDTPVLNNPTSTHRLTTRQDELDDKLLKNDPLPVSLKDRLNRIFSSAVALATNSIMGTRRHGDTTDPTPVEEPPQIKAQIGDLVVFTGIHSPKFPTGQLARVVDAGSPPAVHLKAGENMVIAQSYNIVWECPTPKTRYNVKDLPVPEIGMTEEDLQRFHPEGATIPFVSPAADA